MLWQQLQILNISRFFLLRPIYFPLFPPALSLFANLSRLLISFSLIFAPMSSSSTTTTTTTSASVFSCSHQSWWQGAGMEREGGRGANTFCSTTMHAQVGERVGEKNQVKMIALFSPSSSHYRCDMRRSGGILKARSPQPKCLTLWPRDGETTAAWSTSSVAPSSWIRRQITRFAAGLPIQSASTSPASPGLTSRSAAREPREEPRVQQVDLR